MLEEKTYTGSKFIDAYTKLIRKFWFIRWFFARGKIRGLITAAEFDESLLTIIRVIQRHHFGPEIRRVKQNIYPSDSKLDQLNPFIVNNYYEWKDE